MSRIIIDAAENNEGQTLVRLTILGEGDDLSWILLSPDETDKIAIALSAAADVVRGGGLIH